MEKISDRLEKIVKNEGISVRAFEERIGCSNGVLAKSIAKGTNVSTIWLSKIIEIMPEYNAAWLLTGKGAMIIEKEIHRVEEPSEEYVTSAPSSSCEKCKIKDELIGSLKREVDTQGQFIKHLVESDTRPVEPVQKRKESSANYSHRGSRQAL